MKPPAYLAAMDRLNPLLVGVLHAPGLHWLLSAGLMTISTTGRRSGRALRFPVGYQDQRDAWLVLCANAKQRRWWRNFREPWPAELRIRGRRHAASGLLLDPDGEEFRTRLDRAFRRAAFIPKMFGIDFDPARGLTPEQVAQFRDYAVAVRFSPASSPGGAEGVRRPGPR